ncbi:MAG: hypothetical protein HY394_04105 [Candidatus Diapherotrites archaeon]|nr:hypothetical protein [Candidatus Diapherotrites archaeon]
MLLAFLQSRLQGMPFSGPHFTGPPQEFLAIELAFFLLVAVLCIVIYFRTREIYSITQHRGLHYFRNTFLYFFLAYFFRLAHAAIVLFQDKPDFFASGGFFAARGFFAVNMLFFGYFSTMALLSLAMAFAVRLVDYSDNRINLAMQVVSLVVAVALFATRFYPLLIALPIIVLALFALAFAVKPSAGKKFFSPNKLTYSLLVVFWALSLIALGFWLPPEARVGLYLVSAAVFLSVFLRVNKRLEPDGKKTEPA